MTYRNREGQEIGLLEWAELWEDRAYKVLAEDTVGSCTVKTVWEGMDDVVGAMFATGVSADGTKWKTICDDATTEPEALAHHREVMLSMQQAQEVA